MKQDIMQILMLVGMLISIGLLSFTVVTLIKNADEIRTNGVSYTINKYNFSSCVCYDQQGRSVEFDKNGSIPKFTPREELFGFNDMELNVSEEIWGYKK